MRAIMESAFDIAYLVTVLILGFKTISLSKGHKDFRLFGIMSLILVFGDAFHLVPRIIGLNSPLGLAGYTAALGIGTLVTSVTMTIFYVILYHFLQMHLKLASKPAINYVVYALASVRIILCQFPQNAWTSADAPVIWGIYRNIPFVLLGALIVVLCFTLRNQSKYFRWFWLAITLSFGFYIPVVLWADVSPMIGMLMLPKTICYVYMVVQGYRAAKAATAA